MKPYVRLLKDGGDGMGIETNCTDEDNFLDQLGIALETLSDDGRFKGDWRFQFQYWVRYTADILCKLRGYKNDVAEKRILMAGNPSHNPQDIMVDTSLPQETVVK